MVHSIKLASSSMVNFSNIVSLVFYVKLFIFFTFLLLTFKSFSHCDICYCYASRLVFLVFNYKLAASQL
jgi:hypothetical protein